MSTPLENNTSALQALKLKAESLPSKLIITDDETGIVYRIGINNGKMYYREMTEE